MVTIRGLLPDLSRLRIAPSQTLGTIVLENPGDADALPLWELRGPGQQFVAISPLGEVLQWNGTLLEGETLTIDTALGTVVDGNGVNRYSELAASPRMWTIPPGIHTITAAMSNSSPGRLVLGSVISTNYVTNPVFATATGAVPDGVVVEGDTTVERDTLHSTRGDFSLRVRFPVGVSETPTDPEPVPTGQLYPATMVFPSANLLPSQGSTDTPPAEEPTPVVPAPTITSITEPRPRAVRIEWTAVEGAVYDVYEASTADSGPVQTNMVATFRETGQYLFAGTEYTYWVVAKVDGIESAPGNAATIVLAPAETAPEAPPEQLIARDTTGYPVGWEDFTKIVWLPPTSTMTTPAGWVAIRSKRCALGDTTDYRVWCPEEFVDVIGLEITGGRNWVVQGVQSTMTKCHFGDFSPGMDTHTTDDDPGSTNNRFLRINGRSSGKNEEKVIRVLEGAYARGDKFWEGIEFDAKDDRGSDVEWILQNYRIDQVNWIKSPNGKHFGGDVLQPWRGPGRLVIRGVSAPECTYQGFFLQQRGPDGTWMLPGEPSYMELKRIVLRGSRTWGHAYLLWDTNAHLNFPRNIGAKGSEEGVYVDPAPGEASDADKFAGAALRDLVTWGPSPYGDPVPAEHVGLNYPYTLAA